MGVKKNKSVNLPVGGQVRKRNGKFQSVATEPGNQIWTEEGRDINNSELLLNGACFKP